MYKVTCDRMRIFHSICCFYGYFVLFHVSEFVGYFVASSSVPRNRSERIDTKKRKGCKEGRKSSNPPTPVASLVPQTSPHLIPPTERAGKLQRRSHSMGQRCAEEDLGVGGGGIEVGKGPKEGGAMENGCHSQAKSGCGRDF